MAGGRRISACPRSFVGDNEGGKKVVATFCRARRAGMIWKPLPMKMKLKPLPSGGQTVVAGGRAARVDLYASGGCHRALRDKQSLNQLCAKTAFPIGYNRAASIIEKWKKEA